MVKVLWQLLTGGDAMQAKDIGVITPYTGQVLQLRPCILYTQCFLLHLMLKVSLWFDVKSVMQNTVYDTMWLHQQQLDHGETCVVYRGDLCPYFFPSRS